MTSGKSEDNHLREKARAIIRDGGLPNRSPNQVWGGPGTGARCAICGSLTTHDEVELEVEFSEGSPGSYYFHLRCFSMLELERQSLSSRAAVSPLPESLHRTHNRGRESGATS
jgi:hypothetical protein